MAISGRAVGTAIKKAAGKGVRKLAKSAGSKAKSYIGMAGNTVKGVGKKVASNKGLQTAALNIRAGVKKTAKTTKGAVGVLAGKNVKRAKEMALNAKTLNSQSRAVKAVTGSKRKTAAARAGVAGVAAAVGGGAYAKSKSGKSTGSKIKSAASTAKRKVQAGYKMVYGKLKRVGRSK